MRDNLRLSNDEIVICYQDDVRKLVKFLPWLERVSGGPSSGIYTGEGIDKSSMAIPVYDSTLLSFVREAKSTDFINRNYVYTFSKYRLREAGDELRIIDICTLQEINVLGDILSKYILKGEVKGLIWTQGVQNGVYLALVRKLKSLMEIHQPLEEM